jgi:hypothetical protein
MIRISNKTLKKKINSIISLFWIYKNNASEQVQI